MAVVVGVGTGVIASFLVWWYLTQRTRPTIAICPTLAVFENASGRVITQFRIRNTGRRAAHDLSVSLSVRMSGLIRPRVAEWASVETRYLPVLPPKDTRRWAIRLHRSEALTDPYLKWLPREVREGFETHGRMAADEFLRAVEGSSFRVAVFATDSFSKTRDYFEARMTAEHLREGRFLGRTCTHVLEQSPAALDPADEVEPDRALGELGEEG